MVFNTTFNDISVISWRSVLFVEETEVHGESPRPVASHIMLYRVDLVWAVYKLLKLMVIGTDCIGSNKSNYHMITTMYGPFNKSFHPLYTCIWFIIVFNYLIQINIKIYTQYLRINQKIVPILIVNSIKNVILVTNYFVTNSDNLFFFN
jgi:hypothetical protein